MKLARMVKLLTLAFCLWLLWMYIQENGTSSVSKRWSDYAYQHGCHYIHERLYSCLDGDVDPTVLFRGSSTQEAEAKPLYLR